MSQSTEASPPDGPLARLLHEPPPKERTEYERDRDRVLYSSAFARLTGVTQVATPIPGQTFHNRQTHTLKVAQLSSRLAKKLSNQYTSLDIPDRDAVEASALAHDLGHPPFGHLGEATLHQLAEAAQCGGFDANAQSFRIVTRIALRSVYHSGLNLTRLTLDGMLKYPWLRPLGAGTAETVSKWGAYDSEHRDLNFARSRPLDSADERNPDPQLRSLSAGIVDWADDITYAVHDLEDFYKAGLIPLSDLVRRKEEADAFLASFSTGDHLRSKFAGFTLAQLQGGLESLQQLFALGLARPYDASIELRALIRQASSYLIGEYFNATAIVASGSAPVRLEMDSALEAEVAVLKELLWFYVIDRPSLAAIQHGQGQVLRRLFDTFSDAARDKAEWRLFPNPVRSAISSGPSDSREKQAEQWRARILVDYLAGMTELEAWDLYRTTSGLGPASLLPR